MLTPESRLADFPPLAGMAYLNTAAESIPPACVAGALAQYARDKAVGMRGPEARDAPPEACLDVAARMRGRKPMRWRFVPGVARRTICWATRCTSRRKRKW